jgi:hypothetical protein
MTPTPTKTIRPRKPLLDRALELDVNRIEPVLWVARDLGRFVLVVVAILTVLWFITGCSSDKPPSTGRLELELTEGDPPDAGVNPEPWRECYEDEVAEDGEFLDCVEFIDRAGREASKLIPSGVSVGGCRFPDGVCTIEATEAWCDEEGGAYLGDGSGCDES